MGKATPVRRTRPTALSEALGYSATKVADILTLDLTKFKFVPDVIWCSPCQTYSIMGGGKHTTVDDMQPKTIAAPSLECTPACELEQFTL